MIVRRGVGAIDPSSVRVTQTDLTSALNWNAGTNVPAPSTPGTSSTSLLPWIRSSAPIPQVDSSGNPIITPLSGTDEDFPSDSPLTCAQMRAAGVDLSGTSCASSTPGWVIPAAVGFVVFMLFMGARR